MNPIRLSGHTQERWTGPSPVRRVRALPHLVRNCLWFVAVFTFLAVWRTIACSQGFLSDDEVGLDWVHRTFLITTVYTCGSTLICNVMR